MLSILLFDPIPFMGILLPLIFIGTLIALVLWIKRKRDARKQVEGEEMAQHLGLSYSQKDAFGLAPQLKAFELFRHSRNNWGHKNQVSNVLRGRVGETEVFLFEYAYIVSTGKSTTRVAQTVFFADDKSWDLPHFRLQPEQWWHKVLAKLGMSSDMDFPENPDFSKKFHVTSELEQAVREKFSPALEDFLLTKPHLNMEGHNYYLIAYQPHRVLGKKDAHTFFDQCCRIVALLKGGDKQSLLDLAELQQGGQTDPIIVPQSLKKDA